MKRHESIQKCLNYLIENRQEVMDILTQFSSYRAANAEMDSTISTLQGALQEVQTYQPDWQRSMAVFMPSNVVLYSYALYLLIPSLYVENIDFRPSSHVNEYVSLLHEKLQAVHGLPIYNRKVSQKVFMENSVIPADIVVFTGSYTNAEKIKKQIRKEQLYIFYGQGINPFIIGPDADLELAVTDVIRMRLYNSGQDCLGPDIILVHQDVRESFKDLLIKRLDQLEETMTRTQTIHLFSIKIRCIRFLNTLIRTISLLFTAAALISVRKRWSQRLYIANWMRIWKLSSIFHQSSMWLSIVTTSS
ncbi:aldehyde dehydrogenase family protein [Paenibacillus farraposensis]|uniref:aldehyde dehydrogenase family protein n=1 Tax=Paenibacillus farraposensis TaxID=2807095 RepID=UPI00361D3304